MNAIVKTAIALAVATGLVITAAATSPRAPRSDVFNDQGQPFFPAFTDSASAQSLQVVEWDATNSRPVVFKVENVKGRWVIPSHHNYPADAKERLAKTATSVIGILKEKIQSERKEDHAACGVVDPEDTGTADARSRGKRVTLRDAGGTVLADFIIGRKSSDAADRYFVRVPEQKRIYTVSMKPNLSTKFEDWIEQDLTQLDEATVWRVVIRDHQVVSEGGRARLEMGETWTLEKPRDTWTMAGIDPAVEELDEARLGTLKKTVDNLKIVGVRRKPDVLSGDLRQKDGVPGSEESFRDLVDKGFFYDPRDKVLYSKQGELEIHCNDGVVYVFRFGDVFTGSGLSLTSGDDKDDKKDPKATPKEARYLMLGVRFDEKALQPERMEGTPPVRDLRIDTRPLNKWQREQAQADRDKAFQSAIAAWNNQLAQASKRGAQKKAAGEKHAKLLQDRFADWYYVIDAAEFEKVHVKRTDLVRGKGTKEGPKLPGDPHDHEHDHDHEDPMDPNDPFPKK